MQDWEVDSVAPLLSGLYVIKIWLGDVDKLVWLPFPNKGFKVKHYYYILRGRSRFSMEKHLESSCLAEGFFFFLVCVCVCGIRRILIVDNLRKRSPSIME